MKTVYRKTERLFERFSDIVIGILSNSITFMVAFVFVLFWMMQPAFRNENFHELLRDIILAITFLTLFIIQRSYSKLTYAMHLKLNELIAAQENASNKLVKAEEMSQDEMKQLAKKHDAIISSNRTIMKKNKSGKNERVKKFKQ